MGDFSRADTDPGKAHPLLIDRWCWLKQRLRDGYGIQLLVIEIYRAELRQQWLYGNGRTVPQLQRYGISPAFSQPHLPIVTNAWSAKVSAHGCTRLDGATVVPASAALDVVPVGDDGRPWTADDRWDEFMAALTVEGVKLGLVHFLSRNKQVTDRPHLQLYPEWSDATHTLTI